MKHFFGAVMAVFLVFSTSAQYSLKGSIRSKDDGLPVPGASITLIKSNQIVSSTTADNTSNFSLGNLKQQGIYQLIIESIGYRVAEVAVNVTGNNNVVIELQQQPYFLEPLEVKSVRVSERAPFTKTNLSKQDIAKNNLGQDLPFLLNQTPSVVVNSDAGNGIGYTGIRIRGSDATRTNVTINGIPYNDPESQGTFFVNLPDLASSLSSIQIQRGVGTSSNGAGAFGATINLSTNEFNEKPYAELNNSFGSFNSWKHTVKAGSGLLNDHFTIDARVSKISSDGFIDRASSDLKSLYLSTAYFGKKTSLRFNLISGTERTYQAWYGIPESFLNTNRTFNSAGTEKPGMPYDNETDNYQQDHYQMFLNHAINSKLSFSTALFLVKGAGFYEQYKAAASFSNYNLKDTTIGGTTIKKTDLVRQLWLDNDFYGQTFSLQYKAGDDELTLGGGWNQYKNKHFGNIIWANINVPKDFRYYDVDASKSDKNVYAKWQHNLGANWQVFSDLQYRHVDYVIGGFRNNPTVNIDRTFNFLNPKIGVSYSKNGWLSYLSYARANKEPNRDDFEAGIINQPKHETLNDFELGLERKLRSSSFGATVYFMDYKDQLVLTGRVNDVGAYTRVNIPNSYRLGMELQGSAIVNNWFSIAGNLAISRNKIDAATEFVDDYDNGGQKTYEHNNKDIAFSPNVVGGATINLTPIKNLELSLLSKYVSRQYLDNTQNAARSLNDYYVQDARVTYNISNKLFSGINVIAQLNNVFNKKYEPNGYTFSYIYNGNVTTENFYYPMAGTNFMLGINFKF